MLWQFKHKARRKPTGDNIMTIAERLTEKIHSISYDELPSEAVYWTKLGILDTIAVTLAGFPESCVTKLLQTPGVAVLDPGKRPEDIGTRRLSC